MQRLPFSPGRAQALAEFEPVLLDRFNAATRQITALDPEYRDVMHYVLFSVSDRFCITSAWLLAPHLRVSLDRFAPAACAIETLRCAMSFKTRANGPVSAGPLGPATGLGERVVEPGLAEAAAYGLVPLAFEMVLGTESPLSMSERAEVTAILARRASPVRFFSALHRETRLAALSRYQSKFNLHEVQKLQQDKVGPLFESVGAVLEFLSVEKQFKPEALSDWFRKLGMFAFWVSQKQAHGPGARGRDQDFSELLSGPEAMDLIMSLEAELLERADDFGAKGTAHEIIEPLADALKAQLQ